MHHPQRVIQRSDIVGARIEAIHETLEITDGLDVVRVYFTVDRGFTFELPYAGYVWYTTELPPNARQLSDIPENRLAGWISRWLHREEIAARQTSSPRIGIIEPIKQRHISGVCCERSDDYRDAFLLFEDGSQVRNTMVAPYGTGAAGLYFHLAGSTGSIRPEEATDYFTILPRSSDSSSDPKTIPDILD